MNMIPQDLPVAVIGAGPVGLAAAAHLVQRGIRPLVFERGQSVGAALLEWGHVRVFSPWRYNIDAAARALLDRSGWQAPQADDLPTGGEIVRDYLAPLAALPEIAPNLKLGAAVTGNLPPGSRQGLERRPRGLAFRCPLRRRRRRTSRTCQGGHRRVGNMVAAEPCRHRRPAGSRRARGGGPHRLRHPRRRRGRAGENMSESACWSSAAATRRSTRRWH